MSINVYYSIKYNMYISMGGRKGKSSKQRDGADTESSKSDLTSAIQRTESNVPDPARAGPNTRGQYEQRYGVDIDTPSQADRLQRLEQSNTLSQVQRWADEGIPIDAMGTPSKMQAYRQREGTPVPWDIEQRNEASKRRNTSAVQRDTRESPAGQTQVPDSVRDVVSEPGQSVDAALRKPVESEIGQSLEHARVHRSPAADAACNQLNARAFTVNNHVAVRSDQPDPSTPAGQHLMSHELTHVAQQTGGAVSLLPDAGALEVDPDPKLEREAEETAQRVMQGGELDIQRLSDTDVHVQRMTPRSNPRNTTVDSRIEQTIVRSRGNNKEEVYLTSARKRHIYFRHISGTDHDPKENITCLFPVHREKHDLSLRPNPVMSEKQVFELIEECVMNGYREGNNTQWTYRYYPEKHSQRFGGYGIYVMVVNVKEGEIQNATPLGGRNVLVRDERAKQYYWHNNKAVRFNTHGVQVSPTSQPSNLQVGAPSSQPQNMSPHKRASTSSSPQSGGASSSDSAREITDGAFGLLANVPEEDTSPIQKVVGQYPEGHPPEKIPHPYQDANLPTPPSGYLKPGTGTGKGGRRQRGNSGTKPGTGTGGSQQPGQTPSGTNPGDKTARGQPPKPGLLGAPNQLPQTPPAKPRGRPGLAKREKNKRMWYIGGTVVTALACVGGYWLYSTWDDDSWQQ